MNTTKRILLVHPEAQVGQKWQHALKEAGIEAIMVSSGGEAGEVLAECPVALALVAEGGEAATCFEFAGELKQLRPDLPVVMVLRELKLPVVKQGLPHGLMEVMPVGEDLGPLVKRVKVLLERAVKDEPTAEELAVAEATLQQLDPEFWQGRREARESDERATWAQQMQELQREGNRVEAARQEVDRKTKLLAKEREAMQRESRELRAERIEWELTLSELEVREENLRVYEQTLRTKQDKIEKELNLDHTKLPGTAIDLSQAWEAHNRAAKILEAERAAFRDERMVLKDLDKKIDERLGRLKELDSQLSSREINRRGQDLPPPRAFANSGSNPRAPIKVGFFRSILGGAR